MCTTRALIGQYPCLDQSIQTRKFPAKVNSIIWLNKCITQVNWKISISLLRLTHLVNVAMFLRIIDFKLSLILHLLTCGQPQTDSKTLALVVLSIRHVVHILSSPSQLFEYHPHFVCWELTNTLADLIAFYSSWIFMRRSLTSTDKYHQNHHKQHLSRA